MAALGPKVGQKCLKNVVFQSDFGRFGMLNQVFLARFQPMVTSFGPWKVPKFLENGPFWDQKGVKSESKVGHC